MTVLESYFPEIHSKELEEKEKEYWEKYRGVVSDRQCIRDCLSNDIYQIQLKIKFKDFIRAQEDTYDQALKEIRQGKKLGHWIWYIFPQREGLGKSETSKRYSLRGTYEAEFYIAEPTLGPRLIEATQAVLDSKYSAQEIFGDDAVKVYCCMKLFAASSDNPVFKKLMKKENWH